MYDDGNSFFSQHKKLVAGYDRLYSIPNQEAFIKRDFARVKWSNSAQRNFFTILKVLAEHGRCTIDDIIKHDCRPIGKSDRINRYNLYRRIILGNTNTSNIGLVERGIIHQHIDDDDARIRHYELSLHGIFFALRCFVEFEILSSFDSFGLLDRDFELHDYDYSKQIKYPQTFADILASNYSESLPKIFGKWDYLKCHPRINAYAICNIALSSIHNMHLSNTNINNNSKFSGDFATFESHITMEFYVYNINWIHYPLKVFVDSLSRDEKKFVDMIMYSHVRYAKENYYRAMYNDAKYRDDHDDMKKYVNKIISNNDLMSYNDKKGFLESYDPAKDHSISFRF